MDGSPPQRRTRRKSESTIKGGTREGSGRPKLEDRNLLAVQSRVSLAPEIWKKLDLYTSLRDDESMKYPERHRVAVLRDILTAVVKLLESSGFSDLEQAKLTKKLHEILMLKEGKDNG